MPQGALRNRQDCEDFVRGCLFMGTGGGGGIQWGMEMLTAALVEQELDLRKNPLTLPHPVCILIQNLIWREAAR